jgi:hypothetical protein
LKQGWLGVRSNADLLGTEIFMIIRRRAAGAAAISPERVYSVAAITNSGRTGWPFAPGFYPIKGPRTKVGRTALNRTASVDMLVSIRGRQNERKRKHIEPDLIHPWTKFPISPCVHDAADM